MAGSGLGGLMRISCIRHGMTDENLAGRYSGGDEDSLTKQQREQLLQVFFDSSLYDAVFCSPLSRCIETAECLRIPRWVLEPRIQERNFGIFEGLTHSECQQRFPTEYAAFRVFDADFVIPGGESRDQHWARVSDWISDVASTHQEVLAITHGGIIDFLYRLGTGRPLHGDDQVFSADNATLSVFEVRWPDVQLVDYSVPLDTQRS